MSSEATLKQPSTDTRAKEDRKPNPKNLEARTVKTSESLEASRTSLRGGFIVLIYNISYKHNTGPMRHKLASSPKRP